jgi:DNA-binding protein YbaB
MFDKLQQLQKINELKNSLAQERAEQEIQGVKVVVNGKMEIEEIQLNSELGAEDQARILKDCINQAMSKVQMIAAQKMSEMGGF